MKIRTRLMYALAGMLLVNSAPHAVVGLTGRRHPTGFGRDSSPLVNVLWAVINFSAATLLVSRADRHDEVRDDRAAWTLPAMTGGLVWSAFMFLFELRSRIVRSNQ